MTAGERRKLVGILGRLGSDHDGERAAAGLIASRMLRDAGLQWGDLIAEPEPSRRHEAMSPGWRLDLALAQRHTGFLRPWEASFVASIATRRSLSLKQKAVLREIADALQARGKA